MTMKKKYAYLLLACMLIFGLVPVQAASPAKGLERRSTRLQVASLQDMMRNPSAYRFDFSEGLASVKTLPTGTKLIRFKGLASEQHRCSLAGRCPEEFFYRVAPDRSTIRIAEYAGKCFYQGELPKRGYFDTRGGVVYYEYYGWLNGYDPNEMGPYRK